MNRNHPSALLVAFISACSVGCCQLCAQTVTWVGAGDGTSWTQAANWSPAAVPTATSDVVIPAGATAVSLSVTAAAHSLTLSRALNMTGSCPSLTVTAGITLATAQGVLTTAQASCTGLTLSGSQSISGPGRIALKAPLRVAGAGTNVTVASGATVTTSSSSSITIDTGASLVNQGTISTAHGLNISGASIVNAPGASLSVTSSAELRIATTVWTNNGTFTINGGYLQLAGSTAALGTISRTSGSLDLQCVFTGSTLAANATTGPINLASGFVASAATLTTVGTNKFTVTGANSWIGCTLNGAVAMNSACGPLTITGGLTFASGGTLTTGDANCDQIRFTGVQTLSGTGQLRLGNGYVRISGAGSSLTIGPDVTLTTASEFGSNYMQLTIEGSATLLNQGVIRATAGKNLTIGNVSATSAPSYGDFRNQAGGVVTADGSASVSLFTRTWTNEGTFNLYGGTVALAGTYSTSTFGNILNSNGTLQLFGNFATGSNFTVPAGPVFDFRLSLSGVTLNSAAGAVYRISSGTLANCTFNGSGTVPISGATLTNCTFNAPILTTGTFVTMTAPVFNAPATLGEMTITGGITVNGVTLTKGDGYTRFNGGTQTISGSGTLIGVPAVVGDNTTLFIPSTFTLSADTADLFISINRNARLDSSASIHASGHTVGIAEGYTNGVGDFINRGTITLVNGASLVFQFNLRWQNLGVISTASGVNLNLGGVYSSLGTIDQSAGAPNITLAGNLTVSGPLDIDTFSPSTIFATDLTGVTINSTSGRTFTANLGSSFTNCTFNTPVTFGGTSGDPIRFTNVHFYQPVTAAGSGAWVEVRGTITLHNTSVYLNSSGWSAFDSCLITGDGTFHCNQGSIIGQGTSLIIDTGVTLLAEPSGEVYAAQSPVTFRGLLHGHAPTGFVGLGGNPLTLSGRVEVSDGALLTMLSPINTGSISMLRGSNLIVNGTYPALGVLERDATRTGKITLNGTFAPGPTFVLTPNMTPVLFTCNASGVTFSATEGQTYTISGGSWTNCRWNAPVTFGGPDIQTAVTTLYSAVFDADAQIGQLNQVALRLGLTLLNQHSFTLKDSAEMTFGQSPIQGNGSILFGPGLSSLRPEDGPITIGAGITVTNEGGDGRIYAAFGNPACINNGTVRSSGTGRSIRIDAATPNPVFLNNGTMEADTGSSLVQKFSLDNFGLIRVMPGGTYTVEAGAFLRMNPGSILETQLDGSPSAPATSPVTVRGRLIAGGTFAVTYPTGNSQSCQTTRTLVGTQGAGTFEGSFSTIQPPPYPGPAQPLIAQSGTGISYSRLSSADVGSAGAIAGPDGHLDNNDFIVFCNMFFSLESAADRGIQGGIPGHDGQFDNNDFIVFIDQFFAGC